MPRAPLLQLTDIALTFGGNPVFDGVSLTVQPGERLALVGRNGSGKSTLLKVMAGLVEPDRGMRAVSPGTGIGYLEQDPDFAGFASLGDWAAAGLPPGEDYKVAMAAEGLGFRAEAPVASASGGEKRRAALARLMARAPGLMLLDEPTNHLDINAVRWLETRLAETRAALVLISHDRAFLRTLSKAVLWLDRGVLRRLERGFEAFEDWRETVWAEEDEARHKLERKIKAEARWAVEGISARRKRNQGRVRALGALRAERAAMLRRQGNAALGFEAGGQSGRKVIEARGLAKAYGGQVILRDFDFRVMRGDRVAIVGPNGAGKTTLLKLLLGQVTPDAGEVSLGTGLDIAVFDQARAALEPEATLWESLTGDPEMAVSGRADQVMVRGQPRHVVGYLKDFLFDEAQARAPVKALSGGEKARLLLARIMARQSNLLVLDEPTNDLDVETLDLLQELLGDYPGTVLLVSHDRDFLDRVATVTVAMEGDGRATVYAGGWSDYQAQRGGAGAAAASPARSPVAQAKPAPAKSAAAKSASGKPAAKAGALSFTERHRLAELPGLISKAEAEIAKLSALLSEPGFYEEEPAKFAKATAALAERQAALEAAEAEWFRLTERDEA